MEPSVAARRLASISDHILPTPAFYVADGTVGPRPVVIGGMVLDILAVPDTPPGPGTTTPGTVQYVCGGVARNIAECISKVGGMPFIISVLGNDVAGEMLLKYWRSAGLCSEGILLLHDIATPIVSNLFDGQGELLAAVANVDAVESFLTSGWIKKFPRVFSAAPIVVVDANLSSQCLQTACEMAKQVGVPVWFEPVSIIKSKRISCISNSVTCASPNERELTAMANALSLTEQFRVVELDSLKEQTADSLVEMLRPPILFLFRKGIKLLLVTLGSNGVLLCCKDRLPLIKDGSKCRETVVTRQIREHLAGDFVSELQYESESSRGSCIYHFPALPASAIRLTGAGDCLVGGVIATLCGGMDLMQSVAVGISVAKEAVESETNVPSALNIDRIADDARRSLSAARLVWSE